MLVEDRHRQATRGGAQTRATGPTGQHNCGRKIAVSFVGRNVPFDHSGRPSFFDGGRCRPRHGPLGVCAAAEQG